MFGSGRYPTVIASEVCDFITKGTTPPTGEITEKYETGSGKEPETVRNFEKITYAAVF